MCSKQTEQLKYLNNVHELYVTANFLLFLEHQYVPFISHSLTHVYPSTSPLQLFHGFLSCIKKDPVLSKVTAEPTVQIVQSNH